MFATCPSLTTHHALTRLPPLPLFLLPVSIHTCVRLLRTAGMSTLLLLNFEALIIALDTSQVHHLSITSHLLFPLTQRGLRSTFLSNLPLVPLPSQHPSFSKIIQKDKSIIQFSSAVIKRGFKRGVAFPFRIDNRFYPNKKCGLGLCRLCFGTCCMRGRPWWRYQHLTRWGGRYSVGVSHYHSRHR